MNNGSSPNTALFDSGSSGNQGDPTANTTVFSFTTLQVLTAGVTYQINFGNYMYSGFGGTGGVERNSGWDVVLTQVPEPSSMLLSFAGMAGLALVRRRA